MENKKCSKPPTSDVLTNIPMNMGLWQTTRESRAFGTKNPTEKETNNKLIQVQEQHKPHKQICLQTTIFSSWIASGWDMLGLQMPLYLQHTIETCCGV